MNPNRVDQLQSIDPSPPQVLDHVLAQDHFRRDDEDKESSIYLF